jgi:hypothetical protein
MEDVLERLRCYDRAADQEIAGQAPASSPSLLTGTPSAPVAGSQTAAVPSSPALVAPAPVASLTPAPAPTAPAPADQPSPTSSPQPTGPALVAPSGSQVYDPAQSLADREAALKAKEVQLAQREAEIARAQQQAAQAQEDSSLFGVPMPSFGTNVDELKSDRPSQERVVERDEDGEIDAVDVVVKSHRFTPTGQAVVVLANGSVWQQTDSKKARFPKSGDVFVRIERAAMGSYFMYINNEGSAIRVRRVDTAKRG